MRRGFGDVAEAGRRTWPFSRRVSRLRLEPAWRQESWIGRLPRGAGIVASVLYLAAFSAYGMVISGRTAEVTNEVTTSLGFGVQMVRISGQRETDEQEVLDLLGVSRHVSLLLYDVDKARDRLKAIPWISDVSIMKLFPDKLSVQITERVPYAIWQPDATVRPALVDESGDIVATGVDPRFARLPRVIGVGSESRAHEAVDLVEAAPALKDKVKAAVLVSGLRWDVFLDNGVRLMLPEKEPGRALAEIARLDAESGLLGRDITIVDMRLADRMVVRLTDEAKTARDKLLAEQAKARKKERRA
ncbi:cell division protein FtsQ/DivIB [Methylobrevis pamukkalensis]|uniref:cell division protein FtsQ/DivIB n=1 Tax=Methylobrevis pamukkalensis TaxID=1439726 RepID=UPI00114CBD7F|nr:FtsQ-type POTRA domain-containing protein [Methylobrevis pamukkalensis]